MTPFDALWDWEGKIMVDTDRSQEYIVSQY